MQRRYSTQQQHTKANILNGRFTLVFYHELLGTSPSKYKNVLFSSIPDIIVIVKGVLKL